MVNATIQYHIYYTDIHQSHFLAYAPGSSGVGTPGSSGVGQDQKNLGLLEPIFIAF
jgi:hypothetical protein